jgi:putative intracellular protease/amidase
MGTEGAMNGRTISLIVIGVAAVILVVYFGLPHLLNLMGLHPAYVGQKFNLSGKRALIITTSRNTLGESDRKTGVYASEMTVPYYEFLNANMMVDIASIEGGKIPVEPMSLKWPVMTPADRRYVADPDFVKKTMHSIRIDSLDFTRYDLVFMAGGWGAAYDLGTSPILGKKISEAYAAGKVLGAVCHGGLGFLLAVDETGKPLVKDRHLTAVTDKQVRELRITVTPQHPERELRAAGALFESKTAFLDIFANHVVIDGRIVTGQNQNAGGEVAQDMMRLLQEKK